MKKQGFTLLELIVSIVLVSVVMISLLASLIQLRKTYNVIHENSDVLVYSASATRVINNDLANNNGIRYITCDEEGHSCDFVLGNGTKRNISITEQVIDNGTGDNNIKMELVKSTLQYVDTTNDENEKLIYIRTINMDRYTDLNTGKVRTDGYAFLDIDTRQYEYNGSGALLDSFTTLTVRIYDGINFDDTRYNIIIYTSGRYDDSNLNGKVYRIMLDKNGGLLTGDEIIDEVFGVGYYRGESVHNNSSAINKIPVPTNGTQAFLGFYYQTSPTSEEIQVIDSSGNIVASPKLFKDNISLNDESGRRVYAKWGECAGGYEVRNGVCTPKTYTVTLNRNGASNGTSSITVTFMSKLPNIEIPKQAGKSFNGYYTEGNTQYYSYGGQGTRLYDIVGNTTLNAIFSDCSAGTFNSGESGSCSLCAQGSYAPEAGASQCLVCPNGYTNINTNRTNCNSFCSYYSNTKTWITPVWNENNTVTNSCKIETCKDGYTLENNKCTGSVYYVKYILEGGTIDSQSATTGGYGIDINIYVPTRDGYKFIGWNLPKGFNSETAEYYHPNTGRTVKITSSSDIIYFTGSNRTTFKNLTRADNTSVYFHANWAPQGESTDNYIACEAKKYIKAGESTCTTDCAKNHYCPGGSYAPSSTEDKGIYPCEGNYKSNSGAAAISSDCWDPSVCLSGDTEIEVYDKKKKKKFKKKLKDLTYDDYILAWDFDKGDYVWVKAFWIMKPILSNNSTVLSFSDGTKLKVVGDHRIFNCELNKFTKCNDEKETFIGMHTVNSKGEIIELIERKHFNEKTYAYNVITSGHINVFADGILTSQGSNNIYEIKDMKFVKDNRDKFTTKELEGISEDYIEGLRLNEWIVDDKGSREETLKDMKEYIKSLEDKKRL